MNDVADLMMRFKTEGEDAAIRALNQVDRGIDNVDKSARSAKTGLGGMFATAGGFVLGGAINMVAGSILNVGKSILFANANAEQAKMSLETVLGSQDAAVAKFEELQKFAAETPFAFPELVTATINLESFGLKSTEWIGTIGDTASAMGKSVDQVTQAVLDAQTGQYERLKELGIMASVEGDKVKFKYMKDGQEIVETVDRNNQEMINSTLTGIWNSKYEGAMEKQSQSFIGRWSTLKDNINMKLQEVSGGIFGFASSSIGILIDVFANGFFDTFDSILGPSVTGFIKNLADLGSGIIDAFGSGKGVKELVESLPDSWEPAATAILKVSDSVGDLWKSISSGDFDQFFADLGEELKNIAESGIELGEIVVKGAIKLGGDLAGNVWERIKAYAGMSDSPIAGIPILGGATGSQREFSIGEIVATATLKLGGDLKEISTSIARELGLLTTDAELAKARLSGEEAGKAFAGKVAEGIEAGFKADTSNDKASGGLDIGKLVETLVAGIIFAPSLFIDEPTFADKFVKYGEGVAAGIWDSVSSGFTSFFDAPSTNVPVLGNITTGDSPIAKMWDGLKDALLNPDVTGWTAPSLPGWLTDYGWITEPIDGLIATVDEYVGKVTAAWDKLVALKTLISGGGSSNAAEGDIPGSTMWSLGGSSDSIMTVGSGGYEDMTAGLDTAGQAISTFSANALADISEIKTDLPDFSGIARTAFEDTGQSATQSSTVTGTALRNMASIGMQTAGQMRSVASQIVGAFQSLPSQLSSLAYNAVNSFAAALWSGVPAIYAAATAIASAVDIAVRARLLIASPSALMDEHGKNTVNPFLGHLRRGASEASSLMAGMVAPRLSAGGVYGSASGSGGGGNIYYVFESGSFVGRGAQSEIERMVADGSAKRVNKGVSRGRLESSY